MRVLDRLPIAPVPPLAGDGVLLRMPRRGDFEPWRALRAESRDFLRPWEPTWARDELDWRAYRERVARYAAEARKHRSFTFFLFDAADTTLFGGLTLGNVRRGVAQTATLGYWMGERHAGSGLMARGIEAIKPFVFEAQGLHRLEAACLPDNRRSIRLLEKCGFVREGHLRDYLKIAGRWEDHVLYSLLAEEWSRSAAMTGARAVAAE